MSQGEQEVIFSEVVAGFGKPAGDNIDSSLVSSPLLAALAECDEIRRQKIPDINAPLTQRLSLDTLYGLLADADFEKYQDNMDRKIKERLTV